MKTENEEENELAEKIKPLIKEQQALEEKRGSGITLEKNKYIGERLANIEKEVIQLKKQNNA